MVGKSPFHHFFKIENYIPFYVYKSNLTFSFDFSSQNIRDTNNNKYLDIFNDMDFK